MLESHANAPSQLLSYLAQELDRAKDAEQAQRFAELQRIGRRLYGKLSIQGMAGLALQGRMLEQGAYCQESLLLQGALERLLEDYEGLVKRSASSSSIS